MKVLFKQQLPDGYAKPFAVYGSEATVELRPGFVDLRAIVRKHVWSWLDEVQREHAEISRQYLDVTRWWWVTPMARLDVRPWAQDYLVEPLLFARAFELWAKGNPGVDEVVLIGCDKLVASYLSELAPGLILEGHEKVRPRVLLLALLIKGLGSAVHTTAAAFARTARHHMFARRYESRCSTMVLSESVLDNTLLSGCNYFYYGLLDRFLSPQTSQAEYVCLTEATIAPRDGTADATIRASSLMDGITPAELAKSLWYCGIIAWGAAWVAFRAKKFFWAHFLLTEAGQTCYLRSLTTYFRLKAVFSAGTCRKVVYPYEGKGIEKAILYACQEAGVGAIGYLPHPQYRLALALRDRFEPLPPRPDTYAVCGDAYADYLVDWALKKRESVVVWGSNKHGRQALATRRLDRNDMKVAVLISHPDELEVFLLWLHAQPRLTQGIQYAVRGYKAGASREFDKLLRTMERDFACVSESHGSLDETLKRCDVVVFCATSAGISAINGGVLSVFVDVKNLLPMNACFDDVASLFPSCSATELADRFDTLCAMDGAALVAAHEEQLALTGRIFGAPRMETISEMMQ